MNATAAPTRPEDLEQQLETARAAVTDAEQRLGAATLDGRGEASASKALDQARAEERRLIAALAEAGRRDQAQADAEAAEAARLERLAIYRSAAEWLGMMPEVVELRDKLAAAEKSLLDFELHPRLRRLRDQRTVLKTDLDAPLMKGLPPCRATTIHPPANLDELIARAAELIDAEENGRSIAVTGEQLRREQQERSAARRRKRDAGAV